MAHSTTAFMPVDMGQVTPLTNDSMLCVRTQAPHMIIAILLWIGTAPISLTKLIGHHRYRLSGITPQLHLRLRQAT